jgi:hypothetical protein
LIVPFGRPACSAKEASANAVNGVSLAGFTTVVHPAASAGATYLHDGHDERCRDRPYV